MVRLGKVVDGLRPDQFEVGGYARLANGGCGFQVKAVQAGTVRRNAEVEQRAALHNRRRYHELRRSQLLLSAPMGEGPWSDRLSRPNQRESVWWPGKRDTKPRALFQKAV